MFSIKKISIFLIILFITGSISAENLEYYLPGLTEEQYELLRANEIIGARTLDGNIHHLAPIGSMARTASLLLEQQEEGFAINSLAYVPYPEGMKDLSFEERQLEIFNTMRAISTQEGITYISHRRGEVPHILIRDSWYLETPRSRSKLPDPVADELPLYDERFAYQRDTTFGGNVYRHRYTLSEREIFLDIDNLETMRVMSLIRVIRSEELTMNLATYQIEDGLLLYGLASVADRDPVVSFLGIRVHLPSAFTRRITALQEWFTDELYSRYGY